MLYSLKNKILLFIFLFINNFISALTFQQIWQLHKDSYSKQNIDFQKKLNSINENQYLKLSELNNCQTTKIAFDILDNCLASNEIFDNVWNKINHSQIIEDSAFADFNFFCGNQKLPEKNILNQINRTKTKVGYASLAKRLTDITNNKNELEKRQNILKELIKNKQLNEYLSYGLNNIGNLESHLLIFYDDKFIKEMFYFIKDFYCSYFTKNLNKSINSNKWLMNLTHVSKHIDIYSAFPMAGYVLYKSLLKYKKLIENPSMNAVIKFYKSTLLNMCMAIANLIFFNGKYTELKKQLNVINILKQQVSGVSKIIKFSSEICFISSSNIILNELKYLNDLKKIFENPSKPLKALFEICKSDNLSVGQTLVAFKLILECKNELALMQRSIGEIDMYCSLANYFNEHQFSKNQVSFVKYNLIKKPFISVESIWNVFIGAQKSISNNIKLGCAVTQAGIGHNSILTGPNESGKSTFQKSLLVSLMFAFTIGIVPANSMEISLFDEIRYYQNITDNILEGKSLFRMQAEQFNKLFSVNPNKITYIVFDEPITGADPRICAAITFNAAMKLLNFSNCICSISTHFILLSQLEEATKSYFKNYKFDILKKNTGEIFYPYLLIPGRSDKHIELDIFERTGLDKVIIDNTKNMLNTDSDLKIMSKL